MINIFIKQANSEQRRYTNKCQNTELIKYKIKYFILINFLIACIYFDFLAFRLTNKLYMTQVPNCVSFVFNSCVNYQKKSLPIKKNQKIKLVLTNKSKNNTCQSTSQILNSYNTCVSKKQYKCSNIDTNCTSSQHIRFSPIPIYPVTSFVQSNPVFNPYEHLNPRKSKSLTITKKQSLHQIKPKSQPKYDIYLQQKPQIKIVYQSRTVSKPEELNKKQALNLKSAQSLVNEFRNNLEVYQSVKNSCIQTAYNTQIIQNQSLQNSKKRCQEMLKQQLNLLQKSYSQNKSLKLETIPEEQSFISIQSARANHKNKVKIHSLAFCARTIQSNYDSAGRGSQRYEESIVLSRDGLYNIPLDQLLQKHQQEAFTSDKIVRIDRRNRKTTGFEQMHNQSNQQYDNISDDIRLSSDGRFQKRNNSQINELSNCQSFTENSLKSFQIPIKTIKKKPIRKIDFENIEISQNPQLSQSIRRKSILFQKNNGLVYQCFLPIINFIFAVQKVRFNSIDYKKKIQTVTNIEHPNILSVYYNLFDENNFVITIFQYPQMSLEAQLMIKKHYSQSQSINILKDAANGLSKLHSMSISYGDFTCRDFYVINQVCKLGNWQSLAFQRNIANDCFRLGILAYQIRYGLLQRQIRENAEQILLRLKFEPSLSSLQANYNYLITKLLKYEIKNAMEVLCQPIFYS